jgi:hypothetical protein
MSLAYGRSRDGKLLTSPTTNLDAKPSVNDRLLRSII